MPTFPTPALVLATAGRGTGRGAEVQVARDTSPLPSPLLPAQQNFLLLELPQLPRFIFFLSKNSLFGLVPGLVLTQHRSISVSHAVLCLPSLPHASPPGSSCRRHGARTLSSPLRQVCSGHPEPGQYHTLCLLGLPPGLALLLLLIHIIFWKKQFITVLSLMSLTVHVLPVVIILHIS